MEQGSAGVSSPSRLAIVAGFAAFDRVSSLMADDSSVLDVPELRGVAGDPAFDFQVEFTNVQKNAGLWLDAVFQGWYSAPDGVPPHDVKLQIYDVST